MITTKKAFYSVLFIFILSFPLIAQETVPAADETKLSVETATAVANPQTPALNENLSAFSVWDVVRMVLVLGGVLGVIYLLFYLLKKMGHQIKDAGNVIDVIATKNLTTNSAVHLIKIGGQIFLIGAGDGNIRLLSEITDKETLDQLTLENSTAVTQNRSFSEVIRGALKGGGVLKDIDKERSTFLKQQKNRLKNM